MHLVQLHLINSFKSEKVKKMEEINYVKKENVAGRDLVDLVLSWSIDEVLNQDLYEGQVLCMKICSFLDND